jgi:hypothetical protein
MLRVVKLIGVKLALEDLVTRLGLTDLVREVVGPRIWDGRRSTAPSAVVAAAAVAAAVVAAAVVAAAVVAAAVVAAAETLCDSAVGIPSAGTGR